MGASSVASIWQGYTQVGQTGFSLVYRVANSANFPCGGRVIVLYYIHR